MVDARIPSGILTHPQSLTAGEDATNLHLRALLWCNGELTDGTIPTGALDLLTRRPDAAQLAVALVAAGLWAQTSTGWTVVGFLDAHPSRASVLKGRSAVSAVKAEAGRLGGLRSGEVRSRRSTSEAAPKQTGSTDEAGPKQATEVPTVPDTVYAGVRSDPERVSGGEKEPTTTAASPTTAAREPVAAAGHASPQTPTPGQVATALAILSKFSEGRFNRYSGTPADRDELVLRLAGYGVSRPVLERMGTLLRHPESVWAWSTKLKAGGYISAAWVLGKRDAHGDRGAVALEQLVGAARESLRADAAKVAREAQEARWREAAQRDADARRAALAASADPRLLRSTFRTPQVALQAA